MLLYPSSPVFVSELEPNWQAQLPTDSSVAITAHVKGIGTNPVIKDICLYNKSGEENRAPFPGLDTLVQVIALADEDYRTNKEVPEDKSTLHKLEMRSGVHNHTSISNQFLNSILHSFYSREVRQNHISHCITRNAQPAHFDGMDKHKFEYFLMSEFGTKYWEVPLYTLSALRTSLPRTYFINEQVAFRRAKQIPVDTLMRTDEKFLHAKPTLPRFTRRVFIRDFVSGIL